jgi:hypothetical protein
MAFLYDYHHTRAFSACANHTNIGCNNCRQELLKALLNVIQGCNECGQRIAVFQISLLPLLANAYLLAGMFDEGK